MLRATRRAEVQAYVGTNSIRHLTNFRRSVLSCIDSYDSESRHIFQIFRDLQDSHTFAPLQIHKFSKVSNLVVAIFLENTLSKICKFFED